MRLFLVSVFAYIARMTETKGQIDMQSVHVQSLQTGYSKEDAVDQVVTFARQQFPHWTDDWRMSITVEEVDQVKLRSFLGGLAQ